MSEQRVALVREVYASRPDGDLLQIVENREAVAAVFAPLITDDFEWVLGEPGMVTSRSGPAALPDVAADFAAVWDSYRIVPEDYVDAGDKVVVLAREHGRMRGGEAELQHEAGMVWSFRGDKVWRVESYQSHSRALEAAGAED